MTILDGDRAAGDGNISYWSRLNERLLSQPLPSERRLVRLHFVAAIVPSRVSWKLSRFLPAYIGRSLLQQLGKKSRSLSRPPCQSNRAALVASWSIQPLDAELRASDRHSRRSHCEDATVRADHAILCRPDPLSQWIVYLVGFKAFMGTISPSGYRKYLQLVEKYCLRLIRL